MLLMRRLCSSICVVVQIFEGLRVERALRFHTPCNVHKARGQLLFALLRVFGKLVLKRLIFTLGVAILSRKITRILFAVSVFGTLIAIPSHSVEIIKIHKFLRTFNI